MLENKAAFDMIAEECDDTPTDELTGDREFTTDFLQNNPDMSVEDRMTVIAMYTRYYYKRIYDITM